MLATLIEVLKLKCIKIILSKKIFFSDYVKLIKWEHLKKHSNNYIITSTRTNVISIIEKLIHGTFGGLKIEQLQIWMLLKILEILYTLNVT